MDEAALRELARQSHRRRRHGEVENAVGVGEQRLDLAGHQDAVGAEAGELAGVAPDRRGIAGLDRADEDGTVGVGNRLDQGAAHPPPGTGHDQPHVGHRFLRFGRRYTGTRRECKANGQVRESSASGSLIPRHRRACPGDPDNLGTAVPH